MFEDKITGGVIPKQYIPAVESGIREAMERGTPLRRIGSPLDIALFLRRRVARRPPLRRLLEPRPIFKQFEGEVKVEEGRARREYVCRSKRRVRATEVVERKSLEEFVGAQDASTADCNIIFERKSRKSAAQPAGGLHENCQWVYHEHFYCHYDRAYFRD